MYIYQIMSNNFGYIDIILLGMIAGFIVLRLRNILGRKTGHENKVYTNFAEKKFEQFQKEIKKTNKADPSTLEGVEKDNFLKGAEVAYESILTSFARGEEAKLKNLLTKDMASNFNQAISQRNSAGIKSELTFIGMKDSNLEKFEKAKGEFFATVKFVCEIISVKKDKEDKIIEGNPDRIKTVTDYWKFSKSTLSKSPNWYLAEIISK